MQQLRRPRFVTILLALSTTILVAFAAHTIVQPGSQLVEDILARGVYNVGLIAAGLVCVARGVLRRPERAAWILIGSGLLFWAGGNVYWAVVLAGMETPPYPSPADPLWIAMYPLMYAGLGLLVRSTHGRLPLALWLDGLIAALVVAAIATTVVFDAVLESTGGDFAAVATNLAYPLGDAVLLAFVVGLLALGGWRLNQTWAFLALGLGVFVVTDSVYLRAIATGTYDVGTLVDIGWLAGMVAVAFAAWQPSTGRLLVRTEGWAVLALPAAFALIGVVLETIDHFHRLNTFALILVSLALALVVVRLALTFRDHLRSLARSRRDAVTDPLTSLWNRRALIQDLESALQTDERRVLGIIDLDGFKSYNDTFGHPAGDALLERVGGKLARAAGTAGRAYRLGGDEFCMLVHDDGAARAHIVAATEALRERGEHFSVTATVGIVELPGEAASWDNAMHIADRRLYERKRVRPSAGRQIRRALLSALAERDVGLNGHVTDVAALAETVGRSFGLGLDELEELRGAAELHDIGKIAIPDSILFKPGSLDPAEMSFMRRHTLIGERIVAAVPSLARLGPTIRSSHEHWDGAGYPDGLRGEDIPLAARIIAVCDAYTAMREDRPYRTGFRSDDALAELERCSGSQFDPAVVAVFNAVLADTLSSRIAEAA